MPAVRVAILDEAPAFRDGLAAAFSAAGFTVEEPRASDLLRTKVDTMVVISTRTESGWAMVTEMAQVQSLTVVALLADLEPSLWRRAIAAGVDGVAEWVAPPGTIVDVAEGAVNGELRIPKPVLRNLLGRPVDGVQAESIGVEERRWLQALADGLPVRHLRDLEHVSERVMYRRLRDLYGRLGANNRDQAVAIAAQIGLIHRES